MTSSSTTARPKVTIDGNEAAAYVAHQINEVIAIYPITPSSNMGEWADQWTSEGKTNIWGTVPTVIEMQSEGGAAGACHGALQGGSLTTTFTASQGLLLMIPNMYKIAGELTPTVFHIAARALAAHALSIFGDHSDVMAARSTGFGMLSSNSVQEVMDMALIAHGGQPGIARAVPAFLRRFPHLARSGQSRTTDGRRFAGDDRRRTWWKRTGCGRSRRTVRCFAERRRIRTFTSRRGKRRILTTSRRRPSCRTRWTSSRKLVGRQYHLFDYVGAPDAERVIVMMGSGAEVAEETVEALLATGREGRAAESAAVPAVRDRSVRGRAAGVGEIDRGAGPHARSRAPRASRSTATWLRRWWRWTRCKKVIGGRYGLSSKEFTPAMVKGVFDELAKKSPKNHFTVGINDDVTHTSLDYDPEFSTEVPGTVRALFYGLGADGTVGANKNSIKIIGEETDNFAQGYFVYDSKKSGAITTSHLRFGPKPIHSSYLITKANFVACHQFSFLERIDMLKAAEPGATFLLNSPFGPDEVWDHLPRLVQQQIIDKKLKFYVIDGYEVAKQTGMGGRINTIMQTCFFAISGVLPREEAIEAIKYAIKKTYGKRGESVVQKNYAAVDATLDHLHEVKVPDKVTALFDIRPPVPAAAPDFVQKVTAQIIAGEGDDLPVSAMPVDGTFPSGHGAMGEAEHRARDSGVGRGAVHPVRQVRAGVPAQRDPREGVRLAAAWTARRRRSRRCRRAGRT